jgi:hypothetical protein
MPNVIVPSQVAALGYQQIEQRKRIAAQIMAAKQQRAALLAQQQQAQMSAQQQAQAQQLQQAQLQQQEEEERQKALADQLLAQKAGV